MSCSASRRSRHGRASAPASTSSSKRTLGRVELFRNAPERARELFLESLGLADEVGYPELAAYCLSGLAEIELASGAAERAARLLGAAETVLEHVGARFQPLDQRSHDAAVERAASALGEDAFGRSRAEGHALGLDAVGEVLAGAAS